MKWKISDTTVTDRLNLKFSTEPDNGELFYIITHIDPARFPQFVDNLAQDKGFKDENHSVILYSEMNQGQRSCSIAEGMKENEVELSYSISWFGFIDEYLETSFTWAAAMEQGLERLKQRIAIR